MLLELKWHPQNQTDWNLEVETKEQISWNSYSTFPWELLYEIYSTKPHMRYPIALNSLNFFIGKGIVWMSIIRENFEKWVAYLD